MLTSLFFFYFTSLVSQLQVPTTRMNQKEDLCTVGLEGE